MTYLFDILGNVDSTFLIYISGRDGLDQLDCLFSVVILQLWKTPVLTPFKLITVFLHEASHATACKLTCGKVCIDFFIPLSRQSYNILPSECF